MLLYDFEADLILADIDIVKAFEIKYSMSPKMHMATELKALKKNYPHVSVSLISLSNDFPGIPNMPNIQCMHWHDAIESIYTETD